MLARADARQGRQTVAYGQLTILGAGAGAGAGWDNVVDAIVSADHESCPSRLQDRELANIAAYGVLVPIPLLAFPATMLLTKLSQGESPG